MHSSKPIIMLAKAAPKPTWHESKQLEKSFYMQDWEFEQLIMSKCTEVDSFLVGWRGPEMVYAKVYGVKAVWTQTQQSCLSNFFVRYGHRVYQCGNIRFAASLLEFLKKEFEYDEYEHQTWKKRYEENQKKKEQKKKGKIRRLKAA